jgi:hypothetical protein
LVYRVEGIDLRVGRCMFSGFEGLVGVCFRGLKDWKAYVCGVWRLIGRDTFVGL